MVLKTGRHCIGFEIVSKLNNKQILAGTSQILVGTSQILAGTSAFLYPLIIVDLSKILVGGHLKVPTNSSKDDHVVMKGGGHTHCNSLPVASRFFPEQLLISTEEDGSEFFGNMADINQPLSVSGGGPIVVDAIERNVFWYSRTTNTIYCQSLHSGSRKVC